MRGFRTCAFCKETSPDLIHYSVRRYAHAQCLLERRGWPTILALPACPQQQAVREIAREAEALLGCSHYGCSGELWCCCEGLIF